MDALSAPRGWIFSPRRDFLFFWLPLLFAAIFAALPGSDISRIVVRIFIADQLFNWSHALATVAPLARLHGAGRLSGWMIGLPILALAVFGFILFRHSSMIFYSILAYVGILHVFRQQYGWIMVSRGKAGEPSNTRWLDTLECWNIMLFPFLFWQSPMSAMAKMYFVPNDFVFVFPSGLVMAAHFVHWGLHLFYIGAQFQKSNGRPNYGKYSLLLMTWLWLYGSLVIFRNSDLFWVTLLIVHAWPYLVFAHERNPAFRPIRRFGGKNAFLIQIVVFGLIWRAIAYGLIVTSQGRGWEFFLFLPLLAHYFFDKFIWLRRFDQAVPS